jgi:hypothetical protein
MTENQEQRRGRNLTPAQRAESEPLALARAEKLEPFLYGDYLWEVTTRFVEQRGIAHLGQARGKSAGVAVGG